MKRIRKVTLVVAVAASLLGGAAVTSAAPPTSELDAGAFVRLIGDPADGTVKFQYGWNEALAELGPDGYWLGVYDVTNSHYVWAFDTNDPVLANIPLWSLRPSTDFSKELSRNARPTVDLPNGDYKVNFFVRGSYGEPVTNLAEIEFEFKVTNSTS